MSYDETMGDSRLTAYALGELEGAEREAFEQELATDPALRAELADVRRAVAVIEAGFPREEVAATGLAPLQRGRVLAATGAPPALRIERVAPPARGGRIALAAAGMAAAALALLGSRFVREENEDKFVADASLELARVDAGLESGPAGNFDPSSFSLQVGVEPKGFEETMIGVDRYGFDVEGLTWTPATPQQQDFRGFTDLMLRIDDIEDVAQGGIDVKTVTADLSAAGPPSAGFFFEDGASVTRFSGVDPQAAGGQRLYKLSVGEDDAENVATYGRSDLDLNGAPTRGFYAWREVSLGTKLGLEFGDSFGSADVVPTGPGAETYPLFQENLAQSPEAQPLSTFSIDVDTASYANVRRFLQNGQRPPINAVRVEELVNYFAYDYARPDGEHPFAVAAELGECPWAEGHQLLRIGLRGRPSSFEGRAPVNVVFLIDVSGSMKDADKLPLLKNALRLLVGQLSEDDSIAIVTYADEARLHLEATHGGAHERILAAVESLDANGSTNGEGGLRLAYEIAGKNLREEGVDRVLLASDGDFNVGISDEGELETFIAEQSAGGVELTVLGFGEDNLKDSKLEVLSGRGNGNYFYVDGLREARKVLVTNLGANFETIASDVKIQVDFNPAHVASYRLIGYETRALANRDFADDTKDAGEIGPDHRVTALYEIVPAGLVEAGVRPSKYAAAAEVEEHAEASDELCTIRLRYKAPGATESVEFEEPVLADARPFASLSADTRFAAAVTAFGLALRDSPHRGTTTLEHVSRWALDALGDDPEGLRTEFCDLVHKARELGVR